MAEVELTFEQIIRKFSEWAKNQTNIRSVIIIGSRARTDHPADEWADLDFVVFADDVPAYISQDSWVKNFGNVVLTFVEPAADGSIMERRVMYENGLDVDFAFIPLEMISQMLENVIPSELHNAFSRGAKVLFDKDGLVAQLVKKGIKKPVFKPPSKEEFLNCVSDFWFHAVWTAKHLRRGELWWAKSACDDHLKSILRKMLEWQARAKKGRNYDTWLRGRFLEQWADPKAVQELIAAFAHYDKKDVWQALINTMDILRWVAKETAQGFGYPYPTDADKYATALVLQFQLER